MARQSRRACFVAGHQLGHGDTAASHAVPLLQSYIFERRASSAGSHGDNHKEDQCDEKDHTQQPFPTEYETTKPNAVQARAWRLARRRAQDPFTPSTPLQLFCARVPTARACDPRDPHERSAVPAERSL